MGMMVYQNNISEITRRSTYDGYLCYELKIDGNSQHGHYMWDERFLKKVEKYKLKDFLNE
jgi:hypothetical protein